MNSRLMNNIRISKGREQGKIEATKLIAHELLLSGLDIELLAKRTGLDLDLLRDLLL